MKQSNWTVGLLQNIFKQLFPIIEDELDKWKIRAEKIPDAELRKQATASIALKKFHCQGGGVFALLAGTEYKKAIRFIVAYQTISDYLDNLCDRSTSLDPNDFRMLHEAMKDALTPGANLRNYYSYREEQNDGGYLWELVKTCQDVLREVESYRHAKEYCLSLQTLYADLQVHKHVREEDRVPRLTEWYKNHKEIALGLSWNEFSAAAGSTLGIFCLVSYSLAGNMTAPLAIQTIKSYFPAVQALHILLDYYIDQVEDEREGDLNFCSYYRDEVQLLERMQYFIYLAEDNIRNLPDQTFHQLIPKGLVALYLSDEKVRDLGEENKVKNELLKSCGITGTLLHYYIKMDTRVANMRSKG